MKSTIGMPYVLLMVDGKSLDGRPIAQMTRKQLMTYVIAKKIEAEEARKASKRAERKSKMKR